MAETEKEQDEQQIVSFSESKPATPQPKVTRKDIKEAEDENEEKEEDKKAENQTAEGASDEDKEDTGSEEQDIEADTFDDSDLEQMSTDVLRVVRFLPRVRMAYDTPSGPENPAQHGGGCPACADAADVAIIDGDIAPDEPSKEPGAEEETKARKEAAENGVSSSGGGDEFGGDMGGDEFGGDFGAEFKYYRQLRMNLEGKDVNFFDIPGNESVFDSYQEDPVEETYNQYRRDAWINLLTGILRVTGRLFVITAKLANKVYMTVRDLIGRAYATKTQIAKFYNFKFKKLINYVDEERLGRYEVTAYPAEDWEHTAKVALIGYDAVANCKLYVFDKTDQLFTEKFSKLQHALKEIGLDISTNRGRCNLDDNLNRRKHASLEELGYSKGNIQGLMRYFTEIAKRLPSEKNNQLEDICDNTFKRIAELRKNFEANAKKGKLSKEDLKAQQDAIVAYSTRMEYLLLVQKAVYKLFEQLLEDLLDVCRKVEDSMEHKALVD